MCVCVCVCVCVCSRNIPVEQHPAAATQSDRFVLQVVTHLSPRCLFENNDLEKLNRAQQHSPPDICVLLSVYSKFVWKSVWLEIRKSSENVEKCRSVFCPQHRDVQFTVMELTAECRQYGREGHRRKNQLLLQIGPLRASSLRSEVQSELKQVDSRPS